MERGSWLPWLVFGFNVLLSGFRFDTFDVAQLAMFKPLTFQPPHTRPHGPTLPPDRADSHARRGRYDNRLAQIILRCICKEGRRGAPGCAATAETA